MLIQLIENGTIKHETREFQDLDHFKIWLCLAMIYYDLSKMFEETCDSLDKINEIIDAIPKKEEDGTIHFVEIKKSELN